MKHLSFLLLILPSIGIGHPGVGIVKDSKGNIYYTDLKQVWKITNGKSNVIVPNVHTHELYLDKNDYLYGEGGYYNERSVKFYHYLWVYKPNGSIDTVIGMREQYIDQDFSLAKDKSGNEYYLKRFLAPHTDTSHIYRKSPGGIESIFTTGNFKHVNWIHPQEDGSLFYVSNNTIYKVDTSGTICIVKEHVANSKPSYTVYGQNITIWGVWQDNKKNTYAAVFSDQTVKKIDPQGNMIDIYKSRNHWAPLQGVFDNDNQLWILETSDKNDVRVILAHTTSVGMEKELNSASHRMVYIVVSIILGGIIFFLLIFKKFKQESDRKKS